MKVKRSIRRILLGLSFSLLIVPAFTIKSSAGLLATDSVSANHYNVVASGYLAVYDTMHMRLQAMQEVVPILE